jgi:hypothetical protein
MIEAVSMIALLSSLLTNGGLCREKNLQYANEFPSFVMCFKECSY